MAINDRPVGTIIDLRQKVLADGFLSSMSMANNPRVRACLDSIVGEVEPLLLYHAEYKAIMSREVTLRELLNAIEAVILPDMRVPYDFLNPGGEGQEDDEAGGWASDESTLVPSDSSQYAPTQRTYLPCPLSFVVGVLRR